MSTSIPENKPRERRRRTRGRPFKPGESGNPGGRPKGEAELRALARERTAEAVEKLVELMRGGPPAVAVRAAEAILDRGWGRPTQEVLMPTIASVTDSEIEAEIARLRAAREDEAARDC